MLSFLNENIKDKLCGGCECTGFTPSVTWTYNAGTNTVVATDASTYPAGDDRKIVHLTVYDKRGGKVLSSITAADGDDAQSFSVAALDNSEGLTLLATVITEEGCISDGHANLLNAAGSVGYWDKDNDALTIGESAAS